MALSSEPGYINFINMIREGYSIRDVAEHFNKLPETVASTIVHTGFYNTIDDTNSNRYIVKHALDNYFNSYNNNYAADINDDRMLIISDSHIGRIKNGVDEIRTMNVKYNEKGLLNAYDFASSNNIKNVLHLGDIIEGESDQSIPCDCYSNADVIRYTLRSQKTYLKYVYPIYDDIMTYFLYGNHDYNAIRIEDHGKTTDFFYHNDYFMKELFKDKKLKLKVLGVFYAYIKFCGYPVELFHDNSYFFNMKYTVPPIPVAFKVCGHSHTSSFDDKTNTIYAPTIACARSNGSSEDKGFMEIINEEKEFVFKHYDENKKLIPSREYVIKKK